MLAKDCIKDARYKLYMTQEEFAEFLGIKAQAVSSYERGLKCPNLKTARLIVEKLDGKGIKINPKDLMNKK